MKGAFRNTTAAQIDAARQALAELRDQREMVELRHARASAALDRLTDQATRRRGAGARHRFLRGVVIGALFPGLLFAVCCVLRCLGG